MVNCVSSLESVTKKKRIVGLDSFDPVKTKLIYCCLLGKHLKIDILAESFYLNVNNSII